MNKFSGVIVSKSGLDFCCSWRAGIKTYYLIWEPDLGDKLLPPLSSACPCSCSQVLHETPRLRLGLMSPFSSSRLSQQPEARGRRAGSDPQPQALRTPGNTKALLLKAQNEKYHQETELQECWERVDSSLFSCQNQERGRAETSVSISVKE